MIGLVLAAGAGRRLRPHTDRLPKALVPIAEGVTILDITLANFAAIGLTQAAIVVGCHGERIIEQVDRYQSETGLVITIVENDRAKIWNNAYSLWTARDCLRGGAIVANGDTLHPMSVQHGLLRADRGDAVRLAIDTEKVLGDEEMKVALDGAGSVRHVSKGLPHDADGEFIGVSLVPPAIAGLLVDALERTWRADPSRYYEDAYQLLAVELDAVRAVPVGSVPWTEVDDAADLAVAKELACRY